MTRPLRSYIIETEIRRICKIEGGIVMARKILVAEVLDERDLLAKKITDKIGKISWM